MRHSDLVEIGDDDFEFDEDMITYLGQPFTGVYRHRYPNGLLRTEAYYLNGWEVGLCRKWHGDGTLSEQWYAARGVIHGENSKWHTNGVLNAVGHYCHGVFLYLETWDHTGRPISRWEIDKQSKLYAYAIQRGAR